MQLDLYTVCWSPDGALIAVGSRTDVISIIDTRQAVVVRQKKYDTPVYELQWSPDGRHLAMATGSGGLGSVNTVDAELNPVHSYFGHTATCSAVRFDPVRPNRMASGGYDGLTSLWTSDVCTHTIDRLLHPIRSLCYSADGQFLFSASLDDKSIDVALADTGSRKAAIPLWSAKVLPSEHALASLVRFLPCVCVCVCVYGALTPPVRAFARAGDSFGDEEEREKMGNVHVVKTPA